MACVVYAEGALGTPIDLCSDGLLKAPSRYYMKAKRACSSEHIKKGDDVYVPFNWENVLQLGTKKQQEAFNSFRNEYVRELVVGYCETHGCNPVPVGSAATSARSDIDFNMYSEKRDVDYVLMRINSLHKRRFLDPIDEIFDVNIYGTVVDIFDDLLCGAARCMALPKKDSERQHSWAFLRATEFIRDKAPGFVVAEKHRELYEKCLTLSKELSNKKDYNSMYLRNIRIYLRAAKTEKDPSRLAEIYGKTKYYERETYRSVGATLHIVMKKTGLPPGLLLDSVYDNFGFAAEVLLTQPLCAGGRKDTRVYKTCKYIGRICDALEGMGKKDVSDLKELCEEMNKRRKRMMPLLPGDYKRLCKALGAPARFDPVRFLQAIYDRLVCYA